MLNFDANCVFHVQNALSQGNSGRFLGTNCRIPAMLKGPMQHQVAHGVLDHLSETAVAPGARINEQALARKLGVSRTPVRAVLAHLVETGILESRPRRGFFLAHRPASDAAAALEAEQPAGGTYEAMLLDVLLGKLGATLSQNALMRRYGASRGELLAALRRMTREGLAEPAPGLGWNFVHFGSDTIEQGYRLRMLLEPSVLLEPDYAPDEDVLRALRADHAATLANLSERTAWGELFNLDARFHTALVAGSGNPLAVEVVQKQNRLRRLCEYLGYERLDRVRESLSEHMAILDSLLQGDREWAAAQLKRHLKRSLTQSLRHFDLDLEAFRRGRRRLTPSLPPNGTGAPAD